MPSSGSLFALAAAVSSASAAFQGFNYGNTFTDGSIKVQSDYESEFKAAAGLPGTDGAFNSARLYTMIQGGSPSNPNEAIAAGIKTKTSLLFGLWASAGQESFNLEIEALKNTIDQYCDQLDGLVAGISVGSEDLYRASPLGQESDGNPGAEPETLAKYISEVRKTVKGSCLSDVSIGHVDTWTAYVDPANKPLIEACDWLGMDAYPYFEDTKKNPIEKGKSLFQQALDNTQGVAGGRDVWITETGWPVSGKTVGDGVPGLKNAENYWQQVGCPMFGNTNVWWYTLQDAAPDTPNPSFGIINDLSDKPLYDLSCDGVSDSEPTTSSAKATSTKTTKAASDPTTRAEPTKAQPTTDKEESTAVETDSETSTVSSAVTVSSSGAAVTTSTPITTVTSAATTISTPVSNSTITSSDSGSGGTETTVLPPAPTTDGGAQPSETTVPDGSGSQLNSFGAAAAAIILAVAVL